MWPAREQLRINSLHRIAIWKMEEVSHSELLDQPLNSLRIDFTCRRTYITGQIFMFAQNGLVCIKLYDETLSDVLDTGRVCLLSQISEKQ
jgi:hypothetical protein